jgi:peptidoglycan/xylan/chitin deacetylase (PgdA/CDA1 family)
MSWFASLIYKTRLHLGAGPVPAGTGHIIALHRVVEKPDETRLSWSSKMEVTVAYLEETIIYFLSNNYDIISLNEMHRRLSNNELREKFVVFTFDDAYEENFRLAYPIFKKYNLPFTIYITRALLEMNLKCWWYNIEEVLLSYNKISLGDFDLETGTKKQEEDAFSKISSLIIDAPFDRANAYYRKIIAKYPTCKPYAQWRTMSKEQLHILNNDELVTIGAHSVNHYPLSKLSLEQATLDITESKNYLETLLQKPVKHFSYSYGNGDEVSEREKEIIKRAGFITATTASIANISGIHKYHLHALPRIPLIESPKEKRIFIMSLSGILPDYLNHKKRKIRL